MKKEKKTFEKVVENVVNKLTVSIFFFCLSKIAT
jgi:hypothetical protein